MKDLLEHLTLYDLFGYAFPGSVVVLTVLGCYVDIALWEQYKDLLPYITLVAGVLSYLCGLFLSEAAAEIYIRSKEKALKKEFMEWSGERAAVAVAVAKHRNDNIPVEINDEKQWEECVKYMYSAVQISPETKRIHNYASTEVMCRNLFLACLISGAMLVARFGWYMILAAAPLALLMKMRAERFGKKKREYTIYWFLQKV